MTGAGTITVYTDYKSPYAYLAKDLGIRTWNATSRFGLNGGRIFLIYQAFLAPLRLMGRGTVLEQSRNAHQWRRVRYSYMDCRRQARKRGLTIRGPQTIWDSVPCRGPACCSPSVPGDAVFRRYHDTVFERFWQTRAGHREPRRDRRGRVGGRRVVVSVPLPG